MTQLELNSWSEGLDKACLWHINSNKGS